jgi:hypothetical protein
LPLAKTSAPKALNPGLDLLIPAQWDRVLPGELYADDEASVPGLTGVMRGESTAAKDEIAASQRGAGKVKRSVLAVSGIALSSTPVVVLRASVFLNHRRKKN